MNINLRLGDCLDVLDTIEPESVDAVICDPPYDLTSGGSKGFMGKDWDGTGIAFQVELWEKILRVLKPGGIVKAFSGTRTYHRMVTAMEEAGLEVIPFEAWGYGSGFPKSLNVGKALDSMLGADRKSKRISYTGDALLRSGGQNTRPWMEEALKKGYHELPGDEPMTDEAKTWDGWGTALKPAWEPVIVGRKP